MIAYRTKEDRILVAECVQSVFGQLHAMRVVVIATPVEILELESEVAARCRQSLEDLPCSNGWTARLDALRLKVLLTSN